MTILLNGGAPIAFVGTEEPAACGELISIRETWPSVDAKLSSTIAEILQTKLLIYGSQFYIILRCSGNMISISQCTIIIPV